MVQDMEVFLNRSSTLPFTMLEKVFMLTVELDICLIPALIPLIIKAILVDHRIFIVMVMTKVEICLRSDNFIHITMVDYTFPIQGFLKNLFQGAWEEKIHMKTILIILIQKFYHTLVQACQTILITTCHLMLIQSFHHTKFVCIHIALLLLCVYLM